jgi:metallo-beta-lactamase family protein
MKVSFYGATREVTGSCYLLETKKSRVLIDCGMFQGGAFCEAKNFQPFPFDAKTIDAVILTHAHLDHVGRLPKLVHGGFKGAVYATPPTIPLAKLVLDDAFQIMVDHFKRDYRPMLYGEEDVAPVFKRAQAVEYDQKVSIGDLTIRFREAGHIFGSSFIEVEEVGGARIVFSGDLGNEHVPILREKAQLPEADVVIMESTYGNRIHEDESDREEKLHEIIVETVKRGGTLVIPAFAIERTQQLLYEMNELVEKKEMPNVEVFLDSPMALHVTDIIREFPQYYDEEALKLVMHGEDFFQFPGLHVCPTREQSKGINEVHGPKIVIAGAGMMNGGRILHHLVRYLSDPRSTVLIIGYQAEGTLGRKLYRGDKRVDVLNEQVMVKAQVKSIGAYSAHADQNMLVNWIAHAAKKPTKIYCTHGEEGASMALATRLEKDCQVKAEVPRFEDSITL